MIFKLKFDDKLEYAQAKDMLHLLKSYDQEFDDFQDMEEVIEISEEQSKTIKLINTDYDPDDPDDLEEFVLFDEVQGDDFMILGSTEWI